MGNATAETSITKKRFWNRNPFRKKKEISVQPVEKNELPKLELPVAKPVPSPSMKTEATEVTTTTSATSVKEDVSTDFQERPSPEETPTNEKRSAESTWIDDETYDKLLLCGCWDMLASGERDVPSLATTATDL